MNFKQIKLIEKKMNTQENNKLIAEFMGFKPNEHGIYQTKQGPYYLDGLSFHSSWDWLMPVHKKCIFTKQFTDDDQLRTLLIDAVIDADIDRLYQAVVEFINEYNKNK